MTKTNCFSSIVLTLALCLCGSITTQAAFDFPGIDPQSVMLDDFENTTVAADGKSTNKWKCSTANRGEKVKLELLDAELGDNVKQGRYSLKVNVDFTSAQANQTLAAQIAPNGSNLIPGNDSGVQKKLGMWIYATPSMKGVWLRCSTREIGTSSGVDNTDFASSVNWEGWKYVMIDLPKGHEFHPTNGIRIVVLQSYENYYVNGYFILDDIRVWNASASEDYVAPSISEFMINGATPSKDEYKVSEFSFSAKASDTSSPTSGVNGAKARFSVDGTLFKAGDMGFNYDNATNAASLTGIRLGNGEHSVSYYIEDKFGNFREQTHKIMVNSDEVSATTISLMPARSPEVGCIYPMEITTNNSKDIKSLETEMELNQFGTVAATGGVVFAASAAGSTYEFDARSGRLKIHLVNDNTAAATEVLATVNVNISEKSNPDDVLIVTPISAKIQYGNNSQSFSKIFDEFRKAVVATYKWKVGKRIIGIPGDVTVTDMSGNPVAGATVYVWDNDLTAQQETAITGADGVARDMKFTNSSNKVKVYAGKDGKYSYVNFIQPLKPLLKNTPSFIRAGATADPKTQKNIAWMCNPQTSKEAAILKLAKKSEGESAFKEFTGKTHLAEYNAVVSSGVAYTKKVELTGLEPATEYIYQVGDGETWSGTQEFVTASDSKSFSFAAIGDLQATSSLHMYYFEKMATVMEETSPRPYFTVHVGDIIDGDDRWDVINYLGSGLYDKKKIYAGIDMISTYGNHEYMGNADADNIKFYNAHPTITTPSDKYDVKKLGTGCYASIYETMVVVSLDWEHTHRYSSNEIMAEQSKWMDEVLTQNADKMWKIVTLHYPLYHGTNGAEECTPNSRNYYATVCDKHNVTVMFFGHGHSWQRFQFKNNVLVSPQNNLRTWAPAIGGGTVYFQTGDMRADRQNGNQQWMLCDVNNKRMDFIVRDYKNNIKESDCFTIYAAPIENFEIEYGVVENGTITATDKDGNPIVSGANIPEDTEITFTATPEVGYEVIYWDVNGEQIAPTKPKRGQTKMFAVGNTLTLKYIEGKTKVSAVFGIHTGVKESFAPSLGLYPNPVKEVMNIENAENCTLKIMNLTGATLLEQKLNSGRETINMRNLESGVYFFRFEKEGASKVMKVVKN